MPVRINNFSVRHKTQLYQRLKTVAYTAHKSAALIKHTAYRFLYRLAAEESRYKLAGAVRLVSAGKAAGNKYYL